MKKQLVINCKSYDEEYESNSARGFRLPSNPFSSLSSTLCSNIQSSSGGQANLTLGDSNIELVARLPCCQSPHLGFSPFCHRQCHQYRYYHEHHQYHLNNLHHHHHQFRGHSSLTLKMLVKPKFFVQGLCCPQRALHDLHNVKKYQQHH